MEKIGRWTVGILSAFLFVVAQSALRGLAGEHWALMAYEALAFMAFCWILDRVIFLPARRRSSPPAPTTDAEDRP